MKNGNGILEKAAAVAAINNVRTALKRFWKGVADFFGVHFNSAEEVADKVLSNMLNGVKPEVTGRTDIPGSNAGKKGAAEYGSESLAVVNRRFNEELERLTDENKDSVALSLGRPSAVLRSAGVEDKPMKLYGNKVIKKMKKHGFTLDELKDLPRAVADPIAVFDNYQLDGNRTILTELQSKGKNIMVAVTLGKDGVDVDFNIISSVFGKGENNIVDWLNKGYARYINKAKALDYLHHSDRNMSETLRNPKLVSAAKVVEDFENPSISSGNVEELSRDGRGAYTSDEVSMENDPWSKMAGYNIRSKKERMAFAERERRRMVDKITDMAECLGIADDVEIVTDLSGLQGRQRRAKGIYRKSSGKITIYIPNHINVADAVATFLHEAVAHKGLRNLFGAHFDEFLDKVYANSESEIRSAIDALAKKKKLSTRTATDEYLAGLAEKTDFEHLPYNGWLQRVKTFFIEMLSKIGIKALDTTTLTDNELRFILWRSYRYMEGKDKGIIAFVEDTAMKMKLGVGYSEKGVVEGAAEANEEEATESIDEVNKRFNDALDGLTEDNKDRITLSLGMPSPILIGAGVENKPLKLYGNKVIKKMKKHGFALEELKNLPSAVANPIAVFNNIGRAGNRSILTELHTSQGNILVSVDLGKDADIDFNIVSSVFGKGATNVVDWINNGFATYINKEKARSFLSHQSAPIAAAAANEELVSAAKIVENFENPKIEGENSEEEATFGTEVPGGIEDVNKRFNERLSELVANPNQKDRVLHLGNASGFLRAGGLLDAEILLEFDKLLRKSRINYKNNHPFDMSDANNLPLAIHNPIAIFDNTNGKDAGRVILTELKMNGRNFIVVV